MVARSGAWGMPCNRSVTSASGCRHYWQLGSCSQRRELKSPLEPALVKPPLPLPTCACFMAALPLQDVAIALEVPDATTVPAAVAKLLRVVASLPRLEAFVGRVCKVRHHRGVPPGGP